MLRVAFELDDLARLFVDERHKAAGGFAVEARGRYERVVALDSLWPRLCVEFGPVMPLIVGRVIGECHRWFPDVSIYDSGTDWPARTNASSYEKSPASAQIAAMAPSPCGAIPFRASAMRTMGAMSPARTPPSQKR